MNNEKKKQINEQQEQISVQNKTVNPHVQASPVNNQNDLVNTQQNNSVVPGTSVQQIPDKEMNSPTKTPNDVVNNVNTDNNQNKTPTTINNNELTQHVYQSQYDSQISGLVDKILNGEKFDYDVNSDALFANYADVYERNAKKAAEDALGRSAAASGGYGNSFASAAASQAYNNQMQNLNAAVPQLQELAYQQYLAQKQDDYNQLNMLKGLDDSNYAKYRDSMSDYYADRDFYANREDAAHAKEMDDKYYDANRADRAHDEEMDDKYYDANRADRAHDEEMDDKYYDANRADRAHDEEMDDKYYDANRADRAHDDAFNKMVWENDSKMQEAMAAAELGDYSLLELYTGADLSDAKKWDEIEKGAQIYSATGLVDYLKSAGVNTTQLEDNIENEKFADNLSIALSVYESTGSPKMLQKLGIDTSYMDKILNYTLMEAQKSANGSSGGSGGSRSSGSTPVTSYKSTPKLTQSDIDKGVQLIMNSSGAEFDKYVEQLENKGYSESDIQNLVNVAYNKLLGSNGGLAFQGTLGSILGATSKVNNMNSKF